MKRRNDLNVLGIILYNIGGLESKKEHNLEYVRVRWYHPLGLIVIIIAYLIGFFVFGVIGLIKGFGNPFKWG